MCVNYLHMYVPPTNQLDNENYNLHKCWSPCNFITWNMLGVASRKTIPGEENIYIFEDAMYDLSIFSSKTNIINSFARKYHCIMTVDTYIIYLFFPPGTSIHPNPCLATRLSERWSSKRSLPRTTAMFSYGANYQGKTPFLGVPLWFLHH